MDCSNASSAILHSMSDRHRSDAVRQVDVLKVPVGDANLQKIQPQIFPLFTIH
jgi:hypothetical protein